MFDFDCDTCGQHQLIPASRIRHLVNDEHGIFVVFECWCGALGGQRTGRAAEEQQNAGV